MLVHDIIKINLVRAGYLPNHPYHLISDNEMIDAFLKVEHNTEDDSTSLHGYFVDNYPCYSAEFEPMYNELVNGLLYHLQSYKDGVRDTIPDWVYSYMVGSCIGPNSSTLDRHDLFILLNLDNIDDEFNERIHRCCYNISEAWIRKLPPAKQDVRPPTIFGEPHVIKSLRLSQVNVLE